MSNTENGCMMKVQLGTPLLTPERPLCTRSVPVQFLCNECDVNEKQTFALGRLIQADTPEELIAMLRRELQNPQSRLAQTAQFMKGDIAFGRCKRIEFDPAWVNFGIGEF